MLHLIVLGAARPTSFRPPTFRPPTLSRASLRDKTQLDLEALHAALSSNGAVHGKKVARASASWHSGGSSQHHSRGCPEPRSASASQPLWPCCPPGHLRACVHTGIVAISGIEGYP